LEFKLIERNGKRIAEGPVSEPLVRNAEDVAKLVEACFNQHSKRLLLYIENLPDRFFDLSSLEAGEILQKLRNYNIRLAVVGANSMQLSSIFRDLMVEENRNKYFRLFEDREKAEAWLVEESE
jgi:Domain of unknown function (DUF4180)